LYPEVLQNTNKRSIKYPISQIIIKMRYRYQGMFREPMRFPYGFLAHLGMRKLPGSVYNACITSLLKTCSPVACLVAAACLSSFQQSVGRSKISFLRSLKSLSDVS
jgi:hypothetical protein